MHAQKRGTEKLPGRLPEDSRENTSCRGSRMRQGYNVEDDNESESKVAKTRS